MIPTGRHAPNAFAAKCFELVSFLVDVLGIKTSEARFEGEVTYHDACSGLRELGIKGQPRALLEQCRVTLKEMPDAEICCGFGGTFCVKYPEISNAIVTKKAANVRATGAHVLLAGDLGCLMNMAGKLAREGSNVEVRHVAEILAGMTDGPAIAAPRTKDRSRIDDPDDLATVQTKNAHAALADADLQRSLGVLETDFIAPA